MQPTIVYLHGFASAGQGSAKAEILRRIFADYESLTPDLPDKPADAIPFLDDFLGRLSGPAVLIGSSLGGYYAACYGGRFGWPVVLINPLVDVAVMRAALGWQENYYTGSRFQLDEADLDALAALDFVPAASPTLVLLDAADEVLDADRAVSTYIDRAKVMIYPGGSHRFEHLEESALLLLAHVSA